MAVKKGANTAVRINYRYPLETLVDVLEVRVVKVHEGNEGKALTNMGPY